jgi:hypothetical protein
VPGDPINRNSDQNDADPGGRAAHDPGLGGPENPSEVRALIITEDAHRLDGQYPARVKADGEIKTGGAGEGEAQDRSD